MADIRKRSGKTGPTYQVRYKASDNKFVFKTFKRRKDARAYVESLSTRKNLDVTVSSVDKAVSIWLDVCEKEGRDGRDPVTGRTLKLYEYRAAQIRRYRWDKDLQNLERSDAVRFRSWLLQNYNRYLAQKALSSFHSVILEMMQRGHMAHDPMAGVTIKLENDAESREIPTLAELKAILRAADSLANDKNKQTSRTWKRYRPMIWLASGSGMRPQEYIAVPRQNILEGEVKVTQAVDDKGKLVKPKTRAGRRTIAVEQPILDMVRGYMEEIEGGAFNLVFPTACGSVQQVNNFRRRAWYPLMERADLLVEDEDDVRPKYTPYALRHFFASILIENKVNLKSIQEQMGHADIQTTLDTYGHLIADTQDAKKPGTRGLISGLAS
jgi:integrase